MTGLLPDIVRDAVESKSVYAASESFGVVALVALVLLLLRLEGLRARRAAPTVMIAHRAAIAPLLLVVTLTIGARIAELVQ